MQDQPWNRTKTAPRALAPRTDDSCLPDDLIASVPDCAVECIQEFVKSNYQDTECSSTSVLSSLCTEVNKSGLTIGEGSVQCILSNCSGNDLLSIGVYNICSGIAGALPNTAAVISGTVESAAMASPTTSTDVSLLPTSIGQPDATQQITSVVMATGAPTVSTQAPQNTTTQAPQGSSSSTDTISNSSTTAPGTVRPVSTALSTKGSSRASQLADKASPSSALDSSQVAGIALGASAVALITLAFVFFLCRHRKKAGRRRNKRRSMYAHQTPPPKYDDPSTDNALLAPTSHSNNLSVYDPSQRYYAGVPEEKRRSFWRRSIRPEEIGMAVSPNANQQSSPTSVASHSSMVKLLPKVPNSVVGRSLWPPAPNVDSSQRSQQHVHRPASEGTVFDEDLEAQVGPGFELLPARAPFSLASSPEARMSGTRTVGNKLSSNGIRVRGASLSKKRDTRIPLTPTYDNGNPADTSSTRYPPSSWKPALTSTGPQAGQRSFMLDDEEEDLISGDRKVLRKRATVRPLAKGNQDLMAAVNLEPLHKVSVTTAATDIDENSTPGEADERSIAGQFMTIDSGPTKSSIVFATPQRSPISNLRYPTVPRSAAVSRQAEHLAQPRNPAKSAGTATSLRPKRNTLVRSEASFMVTDTTSSDGHLSDQSIDWPAPPVPQSLSVKASFANTSAFKANITRLRQAETSSRDALRPRRVPSLDHDLRSPTQTKPHLRMEHPRTESAPRAPAPGMSRAEDLYFTVQI